MPCSRSIGGPEPMRTALRPATVVSISIIIDQYLPIGTFG
jgi:hypothetical protein